MAFRTPTAAAMASAAPVPSTATPGRISAASQSAAALSSHETTSVDSRKRGRSGCQRTASPYPAGPVVAGIPPSDSRGRVVGRRRIDSGAPDARGRIDAPPGPRGTGGDACPHCDQRRPADLAPSPPLAGDVCRLRQVTPRAAQVNGHAPVIKRPCRAHALGPPHRQRRIPCGSACLSVDPGIRDGALHRYRNGRHALADRPGDGGDLIPAVGKWAATAPAVGNAWMLHRRTSVGVCQLRRRASPRSSAPTSSGSDEVPGAQECGRRFIPMGR